MLPLSPLLSSHLHHSAAPLEEPPQPPPPPPRLASDFAAGNEKPQYHATTHITTDFPLTAPTASLETQPPPNPQKPCSLHPIGSRRRPRQPVALSFSCAQPSSHTKRKQHPPRFTLLACACTPPSNLQSDEKPSHYILSAHLFVNKPISFWQRMRRMRRRGGGRPKAVKCAVCFSLIISSSRLETAAARRARRGSPPLRSSIMALPYPCHHNSTFFTPSKPPRDLDWFYQRSPASAVDPFKD